MSLNDNNGNKVEVTNQISNDNKTVKAINKNKILMCILFIFALMISVVSILVMNKEDEIYLESEMVKSPYWISSNSLEDFDLYFLQLENDKGNKVYSPLSIKYALGMLEEGAVGESKNQISSVIGDYNANKYVNSENMSFANALFIKDSYKNSIKNSYINTLSTKYNAEVIYDSFTTPNVFNSWVSDKTFKLINNLTDDISEQDLILVNALAIDMEWVNKIQSEEDMYFVDYPHEGFAQEVFPLNRSDYYALKFDGVSYDVKSVKIGAAANRYDIVNVIGEDSIRNTVFNAYQKWLAEDGCGNDVEDELDIETYLNDYIEEIDSSYNRIDGSTDFYFYVDDDVKVFAKNLKEYNGTTLQYIGIMPKNESLDNYIANTNASNINKLINNLKSIELNSFKDGVITAISGYIPMFKFDYELNLKKDLNKLGIKDIFALDKAGLSNLTNKPAFIDNVFHKANIEFSNEGIKAAAATEVYGAGAAGCGFDYIYDVPVEKIDLTFDNPYLFLIRDITSDEVWFTGTVYEPIEHQGYSYDW